jgi:hypothetical protein
MRSFPCSRFALPAPRQKKKTRFIGNLVSSQEPLSGLLSLVRLVATTTAAAPVTAIAPIAVSAATAAAAVEGAITATATPAALEPTAAAAARSAGFTRTRFIHRQRTTADRLAVKAVHCFRGRRIGGHGHERKSPGFVREFIENDLHFRDVTALAEEILQFAFSRREC